MRTYGNAKFIDCPGVTSDGLADVLNVIKDEESSGE